jgi:hypothetical protein
LRLDRHATLQAVRELQVAAASAERGTRLEVVALFLFGALTVLVTLLLVGQALARQVLLEEADLTILADLGMSRAQIVAMVVLRAALTGLAGGALAVGAAVVASPLMPVGLARQAEISPGISIDDITSRLVEDGVRLFADAADQLYAAVQRHGPGNKPTAAGGACRRNAAIPSTGRDGWRTEGKAGAGRPARREARHGGDMAGRLTFGPALMHWSGPPGSRDGTGMCWSATRTR